MKHCFVVSYSALSTHTAFSAVFKETSVNYNVNS